MELSNLNLQTNKSKLGPYYAMKYRDFNHDFGEYITDVTMVANFKDAKVHSDDVAYFAPELSDLHKMVELSGNFNGTVTDFKVNTLAARGGTGSTLVGELSMKGLPYINTTNISFTNGTVQTNYFDLGIIPSLRDIAVPNLAALGKIIYRGNFNGTINNFITDGLLSSSLGAVKTNIGMKFPAKGEPTYTGDIETKRFQIGKFLNYDQLGLVDFKGKLMEQVLM